MADAASLGGAATGRVPRRFASGPVASVVTGDPLFPSAPAVMDRVSVMGSLPCARPAVNHGCYPAVGLILLTRMEERMKK